MELYASQDIKEHTILNSKHRIMRTMIQFLSLALTCMIFFHCQPVESTSNSSAAAPSQDLGKVQGQANVDDDLSQRNVLQIALGSKDHTTLVAAVQAADLENVLVNAGPLTVFAPTNQAFDALPAGTVENLLKPENKSTLAQIIKFHASPGNYQGELFKDGMRLYQASGHYVQVKIDGSDVFVGDAKILGTAQASNGVVHIVDKVLLPPQ